MLYRVLVKGNKMPNKTPSKKRVGELSTFNVWDLVQAKPCLAVHPRSHGPGHKGGGLLMGGCSVSCCVLLQGNGGLHESFTVTQNILLSHWHHLRPQHQQRQVNKLLFKEHPSYQRLFHLDVQSETPAMITFQYRRLFLRTRSSPKRLFQARDPDMESQLKPKSSQKTNTDTQTWQGTPQAAQHKVWVGTNL